eukprot:CAMPEP_0177649698 /NCGR_PEP_ID=MMETSP0447-20121125/11533_1 /TAXON_ID=0 /ORGANISM="Stygamoeba regulata, Strain BSH-02190019" /LENGTH=543 /DNA_ID=CAMNT_0019152489 /DNA_START=114 /DNA_END=1745 /DNA_ORIENTATION=-
MSSGQEPKSEGADGIGAMLKQKTEPSSTLPIPAPLNNGTVTYTSFKKKGFDSPALLAKDKILKGGDKLAICGQKGKLFEGDRFLKPIRVGIDETEKNFYEYVPDALRKFVPKYIGTEVRNDKTYLVLENLLQGYRKPGMMDIKVGLAQVADERLSRDSVANLLGCYLHGVQANKLMFRNHVNGYEGKQLPVDHFDMIVQKFFKKVGPCRDLIERLNELIQTLRGIRGARFASASVFFVFEQDKESGLPVLPPSLHLIDFERVKLTAQISPDETVIKALLHVLYEMRKVMEDKPITTIYLVRHAERYDYTDMNWAPKQSFPHDSPLSPVGDTQAMDIADRLGHIKPHMVVTSPFQRAIMTAEPIARRLHTTICVEPGIAEFLCKTTRKKVPNFITEAVSVSPWVDTEYEPFWPELRLETWDEMFERVSRTVEHLVKQCRGKGDLILVSHRSTLQNVLAGLAPNFDEDRKLEYGAIAMIVEGINGEMEVQTFNEVAHLRNLVASPSSNPYRHIEGYYEDLDWSNYKSSSKITPQGPEPAAPPAKQ